MTAVLAYVQNIPRIVPLAVTGLVLLLWYIRFFLAMAPKKGTTEWIAMVDKPDWSGLRIPPFRVGSWIAIMAVIALATANCLLRMDEVYGESMVYAAFAAGQALCFCLALLCIGGSPLAAFCGSVLLLLGELPAIYVALGVLLLVLAFGQRKVWLGLLLAAGGIAALVYYGWFLDIRFQLPGYPLLYLLYASAIPVCLVQGIRRRDPRFLIAGALGVLTLPLLVIGMTAEAWMGSLLAFFATLAGGEHRGAKKSAVATAILLILCMFIY